MKYPNRVTKIIISVGIGSFLLAISGLSLNAFASSTRTLFTTVLAWDLKNELDRDYDNPVAEAQVKA